MRAVGFREYGGPERIETIELRDAAVGFGEVRVRVTAATVNPADLQFCRGDHRAFVADAAPPFCGGLEFVGTVDTIGPGVPADLGLAHGMVVAGTSHFIPTGRGAHAEHVVVPAASVVEAPPAMGAVDLATVPMNGLTARVALDSLPRHLDGPVVVSGAAGAVGSYFIEQAVARGLEVLAISARSDESWLRDRGITWFVARGDTALARVREILPRGAPAVVDAAKLGTALLPSVADGGCFLALRPGHVPPAVRGIEPRLVSFRRYQQRPDVLGELVEAAAAGELTTRVAGVFAPSRAPIAFETAARAGLRGRVVLDWRLDR